MGHAVSRFAWAGMVVGFGVMGMVLLATASASPLPTAGAAPSESVAKTKAPAVRLVGVVVEAAPSGTGRSSAGAGLALMAVGNDTAKLVKTGAVVMPGWRLDAVSRESAVLLRMDTSERVVLVLDPGPARAPAATPPVSPSMPAPPVTLPAPVRPKGPVSGFVAPV